MKRWKALVWIAAFAAIFFCNQGFRRLLDNGLELHRLDRRINELRLTLARRGDDWKAFSSDPSVLERQAREELGFIKKGEIEYRFPPPADGNNP